MIQVWRGQAPSIHPRAYIHPSAILIGRVKIAEGVSIWPGCVLRGDVEPIVIGAGTNLQDGTIVHTSFHFPVRIGRRVTVGHGAILHGCKVEDGCLIGMGAALLDGARVLRGALVGARALITEGQLIPAHALALGVPAKVIRKLNARERRRVRENAWHYLRAQKDYL